MFLLINWFFSALALLLVAYIYSGVSVASLGSALLAALVIGALNLTLKPILIILTIPVTVITLGLFLFIINALVFWSASGLLSGFHVNGFGAALIGSLLYSLIRLGIVYLLSGLGAGTPQA